MNAVWAWVRLDLRARARSLAFLALLVAVTAATVMTAVAGARRGASAVDRLLERTRPATIAVLPNQPGFDWDEVRAIPGVEALARFVVSAIEVEGFPPNEAPVDFAWADPSIMDTIERPVVLEGRLPDPSRPDEAVITANFESSFGAGVGDTVTLALLTPEQVDDHYDEPSPPPAEGPRVEARIVGVVRSPWFSDIGTPGVLVPSPGLYREYEANLIGNQQTAHLNALIRLEGGTGAIPEFRERLAEVTGRRDIEFFDLAGMAAHAEDVTAFEANSLLAFALAAALAAAFLVGQAITRYTTAALAELELLRAFGMTPGQRRVAAIVGPAAAAVPGAAAGAVVAYSLSSRFPMGTARPLEPVPGRAADWLVLLAGGLGIPLLVAAGSWTVAWLAARPSGRTQPRSSAVAAMAARWGAPVPVTIGTRFALEPGRGSQAVPVRPAFVGAVLGVAGVVAAVTFAHGVADAADNPARFGQVFELQAYLGFNGEDFAPTDELLDLIAGDRDVVAVNDTRQGVGEVGTVDLPVFTLDPVGDPLAVVVTEGRLPAAAGEVTLAPSSLEAIGAQVGDEVQLAGTGSTQAVTVTGVAFVPIGSHNEYDEGAWAGRDTYDELFDGFKFHTAEIAVREGVDPAVVAGRVGTSIGEMLGDPTLGEQLLVVRSPPTRLAELRQVRRIPLFLAGFLALLAVGAVGHALATAVRRRRHDIAVLRALGITRGQSRVTVVTQASILGIVGLVVGVPLGLALGRTLWRTVADSTPVAYVSPVALWLLVLIAPLTILIVNALAAWPSHRAASLRVSHVLRAE